MPNYKRPGAYINEVLLSQQVPSQNNNDAIGCIVGPVVQGPTAATVVNTWAEYVRLYGSYSTTDYMGFAAYLYFANGGRPLAVKRVTGTGATAATVSLTDRGSAVASATVTNRVIAANVATLTTSATHTFLVGESVTLAGFTSTDAAILNGVWTITGVTSTTFTFATPSTATLSTGAPLSGATPTATVPRPLATMSVSAANPGAWGNNLRVEILDNGTTAFDVVVYLGGSAASNIVERFTNLVMESTSDRYAISAINFGSRYIVAANLNSVTAAPANRPSASGVKALASGADGSAPGTTEYATALTSLDILTQPLIINMPGEYTLANVNAATAYAEGRGDCFVVIDTQSGRTAAQAVTFAGTPTATSYGAVYFPWVTIADPLSSIGSVTRNLPPGGAVLGQFVANDVSNGVWKAPAGYKARLTGPVAIEAPLTNADLDALNNTASPVNAIRNIPGAGICIMGARTLKQSAADRYVNVRRTLIMLKREITSRAEPVLFENNDGELWDLLRFSLTNFLTQVWQQGGLVGTTQSDAFYVRVDGTNNTAASIANGEVHVEVGVALQNPAEYVVINLGQIQGATSVSEA